MTPEMVAAGASVLYWLDGEASKEAQAKSISNPQKEVASAYYVSTEAKIEDDGEERR